MSVDRWFVYWHMYRSRCFELAVKRLWEEGRISGEMHLGTGEEAVIAAVVLQLKEGDAMALDHRGSAPLLMAGVEPALLLREFLGRPDGLCAGQGGHMHLFSPPHLAASSGIVGASGPAAVGFALAAHYLRPKSLAVAFFGEGAMNQGMVFEAMNLASTWKLPVLFVCKDNQWAITTQSPSVTAGRLIDRARALALYAAEVNGLDIEAAWTAASQAVEFIRRGGGPVFLHFTCSHLDGHFLGDPMLHLAQQPVKGLQNRIGPMLQSLTQAQGAPLEQRLRASGAIVTGLLKARDQATAKADPLPGVRQALLGEKARLEQLEAEVEGEIQHAVSDALQPLLGISEAS